MSTMEVDLGADLIDSRDVVDEYESVANSPDDAERAEVLAKIIDQAAGYCPDWEYGATLIRDSYFKEYAEQLADDIGAINSQASWPNNCIDWDAAAEQLQMDYTTIDVDGVDYWIR